MIFIFTFLFDIIFIIILTFIFTINITIRLTIILTITLTIILTITLTITFIITLTVILTITLTIILTLILTSILTIIFTITLTILFTFIFRHHDTISARVSSSAASDVYKRQVVAIAVWLLHWLYLRSSKERAFVRTGLGGEKVVVDGGAFVLPILHDVIPVNMNTLRLEGIRGRDKSLITKDRMRVDVIAEFYVRVAAKPESVAAAAQTLGQRTLEPERLKELIEGKFVDALRTAAADMTMEELHEKRGAYVRRVGEAVAEDLTKNGLELEAASLTQLDQTSMEYFNPSNAFDAEGLTRLTEQIEHRKKQRNDVEQDTLIAIRNKNLEAEKLSLGIDRESELARLQQNREVEFARARQRSELTTERVERDRDAESAQKIATQHIES